MSEQELKLHVPKAARAGVERELMRGAVTRVRLRALYFDTSTRELARANVALRLRQEGRQWIQTLKMPGDHVLARLEINHVRPGPILDLSVYAGTPAEPALGALAGELGVCYETDIRRVLRKVRTRHGVVEVSFDTGCVRAGGLELPVSEVEFELMSGQLAAIFLLGARWLASHSLVLDVRSKSERGDKLASLAQTLLAPGSAAASNDVPGNASVGEADMIAARTAHIARFWEPRSGGPVLLDPKMTPEQALATVTIECLDQIARNAGALAEIDTAGVCAVGTPEHVHQLRVGIRRLRSAWSLFNGIADLPPLALREAIKVHFSLLGGTRDDDVLRETLMPVLRAAGQPPLDLQKTDYVDHTDQVSGGRDFQGWLVDMLAWTLNAQPVVPTPSTPAPDLGASPSADEAQSGSAADTGLIEPQIIPMEGLTVPKPVSLRAVLTRKLRKWHRQVVRDGLRFEALDIETRHALRKRAKRLRYGLQFAETLLPTNRLRNYRKQLSAVQNELGEMNDLAVGLTRFEGLRDTQPSAWFACGWIHARLDALVHETSATFRQLARTTPFWR